MAEHSELYKEIGRRIMDPKRLQVLCEYPDEYGDDMLDKLMAKLRPTRDTAWRFGFDENMVSWLLVLRDLATQQCLEESRCPEALGDTAYAASASPASDGAKSLPRAAEAIAREILQGLEGPEVDAVIAGAARVAAGKDVTAEEKLACVTQEVFDHADLIAEQGVRTLYRFHFLAHVYQDKVAEVGKLVDFEPLDFSKHSIKLRTKKE